MAEENTIDVSQIAEALNTNEELRGQILETISSTESGKSYLDTYAQTHFEKNVGVKVGELYGNIDNDLKELGFEKPNGVKTYDFLKETVSSLKEKASSADPNALIALQKERDELMSKLENNEQAKHFKDLYESTKSTYAEQLAEKEQLISDFNNKQRSFTIKSELDKELAGLTLNDTLPNDVRDTYIQTVYAALLKDAKVLEDGSVAFYDGEELIINKKTAGKASAKEILADKLKSIIAEKGSVAGSGGKDDDGTKRPSNVTLANAKTQTELSSLIAEKLLSDGLLKGSDAYVQESDKLFGEYSKGLPLR
jgi:hypothetical protein